MAPRTDAGRALNPGPSVTRLRDPLAAVPLPPDDVELGVQRMEPPLSDSTEENDSNSTDTDDTDSIWDLMVSKGLIGSTTAFVYGRVSLHRAGGFALVLQGACMASLAVLHTDYLAGLYTRKGVYLMAGAGTIYAILFFIVWYSARRALQDEMLRNLVIVYEGKKESDGQWSHFAKLFDSLHMVVCRILVWGTAVGFILRIWQGHILLYVAWMVLIVHVMLLLPPCVFTLDLWRHLSDHLVQRVLDAIKGYAALTSTAEEDRAKFWRRMTRMHKKMHVSMQKLWGYGPRLHGVAIMAGLNIFFALVGLASEVASQKNAGAYGACAVIAMLLAGSILSLLYSLAKITQKCMATQLTDESILSATLSFCGSECMSEYEAAAHHRFLTYLQANPTGVQIGVLINTTFLAGIAGSSSTVLVAVFSALLTYLGLAHPAVKTE